MDLFEEATCRKYRFPSRVGALTVEQLWDLPLQGERASLDSTARLINNDVKSLEEESFVATKVNPEKAVLAAKLEIVKHIIAVRLADIEAKKNEAARKAEKQKLLSLIEEKDDEALKGLTRKQLEARLAKLD